MSIQRWTYEIELEKKLLEILNSTDNIDSKLEKIYIAFKNAKYEWKA